MDFLEFFLLKIVFLIGPVCAISLPIRSRFVRQTVQISDEEMLLREICQIGDGEYRHPYSCNKYLQCNGGAFTEKDCPSNMVYDIYIKACNWRRKMKCVIVDGLTDFGDNPSTPASTGQQAPDVQAVVQLPKESSVTTTTTTTTTSSKTATKKMNKNFQEEKQKIQIQSSTVAPSTEKKTTKEVVSLMQPKQETDCVIWEDE